MVDVLLRAWPPTSPVMVRCTNKRCDKYCNLDRATEGCKLCPTYDTNLVVRIEFAVCDDVRCGMTYHECHDVGNDDLIMGGRCP